MKPVARQYGRWIEGETVDSKPVYIKAEAIVALRSCYDQTEVGIAGGGGITVVGSPTDWYECLVGSTSTSVTTKAA